MACSPLQGSLDNISIILVCFPGAPQLSAEAIHQEAELEDLLESKVAGAVMWRLLSAYLYSPTSVYP